MLKRLGVERLPNKGGSMLRFQHDALESIKGDGQFVVHRISKKKRDLIYRNNFRNFLYPTLKAIVNFMRKEGHCEE